MTTEEQSVQAQLIPIYVMGKQYMVPESLTIMKAMEYVGFRFIRGCGCRGGICGACSTVFRREGDYRLYTGLACQTVVEPGMYLTQIPFYPALRKAYEFEELQAEPESIFEHYPEIFRCVACNACTKVCPMDVEVMDYVSALKRGDIERAAEISFDCIQCGLCASRCMGELPQYHIAQMARRLSGGKLKPKAEHLAEVVAKIADGKFDEMLDALKSKSPEELRDIYSNREMEPAMSGDDWQPDSDTGL